MTIAGIASNETLAALRKGLLEGARELRLPGLGLEELPGEIFDLADTLQVLDIGSNRIRRLPAGFAGLHKLEVLFASGNPLDRLPAVLGACPALSQLGFRECGLHEIPSEALPPRLRWLTLTGNQLEAVPAALADRPQLQKLLLAGNRLRALPEALQEAPALELIRLSANDFDMLPPWLTDMPRLAWLAYAGNPFDLSIEAPAPLAISWSDLTTGALLGEGASGRIYGALHRRIDGEPRGVAVKLFKNAMTSDGLPAREMAACLAAGEHPHLAGGIGLVAGHPAGAEGLVMPLMPSRWRALAGPPSLASCSRDVYDPSLVLTSEAALRIATGIAEAGAHLHGRGLLHGDLYAHNILWDGEAGNAVLSDFGAASFMPAGAATSMEKLDVLAFGLLLNELLLLADRLAPAVHQLQAACASPKPAARPRFVEIAEALRQCAGL